MSQTAVEVRAAGTVHTQTLRCAMLALMVSLMAASGCAQRVNPSFAVSIDSARDDLDRMEGNRKALQRPLVIVTGFLDPGVSAFLMNWTFSQVTDDRRIVLVQLFDCWSMEVCREKIVEAVDQKCPWGDSHCTTEVDVIGVSLGGLAARYAADPASGTARRLRIARLFTISSPNQGSEMADLLAIYPLEAEMQHKSKTIERLNAKPCVYPVFAYVRLGDRVIGAGNTWVAGNPLWWVATPPLNLAHSGAAFDPRIQADILRRLRGEMPWARLPTTKLPV